MARMAKAFAIIVLRGARAAAAAGWLAILPSGRAAAVPTDSLPAGEIYWIPLPVEEIETPEELDASPFDGAGFSARVAVTEGHSHLRHATVVGEGASVRAGVSLVGGTGARDAFAVSLSAPKIRLDAVAGRVAARYAGSTFGEAVGLSRRAARVPIAWAAVPQIEAPTGASSPTVEGVGVRLGAREESPVPGAWALVGRALDSEIRTGAAGIDRPTRWGAWTVAAGALAGAVAGSAGVAWRSTRGVCATEVTVARRGAAAIVSAENGNGPLRLRGRWRYRSWDARPATCELSAETGSRRARGRLRVLEGPSGPVGTVGRVEFEARVAAAGAGPVLIRAGRSRTEGFSTTDGATLRRERYVVLDAALARAGGRALSIVASRRASDVAGAARVGATLGARLDLTWRRRGRLDIVVEATRVESAGGAAWESGFHTGGSTSLHTRTRPGVGVSARGLVMLGPWRLGGVLEEREDGAGRRSTAATIWIQKAIRAAAL